MKERARDMTIIMFAVVNVIILSAMIAYGIWVENHFEDEDDD